MYIPLVLSAKIRKTPIHLCITRWGTDLARWRNDLISKRTGR